MLVLCPPHLTRKWQREVEATIPPPAPRSSRPSPPWNDCATPAGPGPLFAILSRERAKLSYRWATADGQLLRDEHTGEPFRIPCCPVCATPVVNPDGVPLTDAELARRKRTCDHCGAALWQADRRGPRRYPLADYIKQRLPGWFDLLIADEVHEYKGRGSAQGIAAGILADACGTSLALTGTLAGGYASTLFHLLYRFSPALRAEFGHGEDARWIARYGFVEHTVRHPADEALEDGRHSRRRRYRTMIRERPGLAPAALFHLIGHTVFLRLADVAAGLPPYAEQVRLVDLDDTPDETDYSVYTLRQASRRSWRIGQTRPVQVVYLAYRQTLQADALTLVAKKLQSSLAVEGELLEDGLAAYGDDGDDLLLALARQIVSGEADTEPVEAVFAQAQAVAADAEALLVDEAWQVATPAPAVVEVPATGANGKSQAAGAVNGHGQHGATPAPQQELISWAEFLAQVPAKPKGRRQPPPTSLPLFEWLLAQEREAELVSAGR